MTAASPRPKYVLIVEDDDDARDVLGELIGALGHHPLHAATAHEALRQIELREYEKTPLDVAFIDLGLPEVDGCEVARRIRSTQYGASIRLVALTGYSDEGARRTAELAGFDQFIVKPAFPGAIEQAVNT